MITSQQFLTSVLDTVTDHIVVVDDLGAILFVNHGWRAFGENNDCEVRGDWQGINYLEECERAAAAGDELGRMAADGIKQVMDSEQELFYFEYPCHSPEEQRWFMMRVTPFALAGERYFVISHQNITERKLAEEEVLRLSLIDGLTGIANRRSFDDFIEREWRRCVRMHEPMSLAIIDIDHFKLLNDTYGHQQGDACLKQVTGVLQRFARRPGDMCARYGGEEFAIVYGNTAGEQSLALANRILEAIRALNIPNRNAPERPFLTASIGLASAQPAPENDMNELIEEADRLLYSAKDNGRNRVVHGVI